MHNLAEIGGFLKTMFRSAGSRFRVPEVADIADTLLLFDE